MSTDNSLWKWKTESGKLKTVNPLCAIAGDSLFELLTINSTLSTLHFIWAFRFASGFPLYLCSPCLRIAPKVKIRLRHFDKLSDLVPVPETRPSFAPKGCRSNP